MRRIPLHRLLLPALASLALVSGCGGEAPEAERAATPVVTAPVSVRDLEVRIEATGQLLAKNEAQVAAEVAGQVTHIAREEGDAVAAGDVVLEIDPEKRRLELENARARLAEVTAALRDAERDAQRIRALFEQSIASQQRLDQAETERSLARSRLDAARAQVGVAERAHEDSTVRAPFDGRLDTRLVSRGEFVSPGTPLFDLVALDPIEVEFNLAEVDLGRVAVGAPVEVTVAPYPEAVFDATVAMIAPTIDPVTRTLRVKAALANPEGRLRPGLFARVNLGVETRRNVLMVPEEALLRRADGDSVLRLGDQNRVERVAVTVGVHREGEVEVGGALRPTDLVVTRGHAWLEPGQVVDPRRPDGTRVSGGVEQTAAADAVGGATP